ncbi:MAG: hypothetical protein LBS69_06435 [Prevotellaceae bacterium]|jgi:hypothetical protein|nr:hypothetical protein [Prevotellaceae bacterium]
MRKKLQNIVGETMKEDALNTLKGGFEDTGTVKLEYGCDSDICSTRLNPAYCNHENSQICKSCVCTSGVGPATGLVRLE